MNHAALRALIDSDAGNAVRSDAEVLAWLQATGDTTRKLSLADLVTALDDIGALATIQAAAVGGDATAVALVTLIRTMRDYGRESINFEKSTHAARMQALVDASFITDQQRTAIEAKAVTTDTPRWPGRVVLGDVIAARALP